MATDLTLYLDDQPGELARIGDVLGQAGANIAGLCAVASGGGQAEVHILVHDATAAFEALQRAGIRIAAEQEVLVLEIEDRPGALGEIARQTRRGTSEPDPGRTSQRTPGWCWPRTTSPPRKPPSAEAISVRLDCFSCALASLTVSAASRLACLALS